MRYFDPNLVIYPQSKVSKVIAIYDGGPGEVSIALLKWNGEDSVGMRWNGESEDDNKPSLGVPQSFGKPYWFLIPDFLDFDIRIVQALLDNGKVEGPTVDRKTAETAIHDFIAKRGGKFLSDG